jgi:hypothetical protein
MKTCSYCGKQYPDDANICELDHNPLIHFQPKPIVDSSSPSPKCLSSKQPITGSQILSIGGFAVLAGLSGFGATWLVIGFLAKVIFKTVDKQLDFAAKCMPILLAGGVISFVIGLVVSMKVAKADSTTEAELEEKYVGQFGRLKIYFGVPIFIMAAIAMLTPLFKALERNVGPSVAPYVMLGIALIILAAAWALYDHIPKRFIIPIGIIGWMLTGAMIFLFAVLHR